MAAVQIVSVLSRDLAVHGELGTDWKNGRGFVSLAPQSEAPLWRRRKAVTPSSQNCMPRVH
jgi:hypothetical protein